VNEECERKGNETKEKQKNAEIKENTVKHKRTGFRRYEKNKNAFFDILLSESGIIKRESLTGYSCPDFS